MTIIEASRPNRTPRYYIRRFSNHVDHRRAARDEKFLTRDIRRLIGGRSYNVLNQRFHMRTGFRHTFAAYLALTAVAPWSVVHTIDHGSPALSKDADSAVFLEFATDTLVALSPVSTRTASKPERGEQTGGVAFQVSEPHGAPMRQHTATTAMLEHLRVTGRLSCDVLCRFLL